MSDVGCRTRASVSRDCRCPVAALGPIRIYVPHVSVQNTLYIMAMTHLNGMLPDRYAIVRNDRTYVCADGNIGWIFWKY